MYYLIGADGKQYGPVDAATVEAWIRDGRAAGITYTFKVGETEWAALSTRPEFQAALEAQAAALLVPAAPPPVAVPAGPGGAREWLVALMLSIFLGVLGVDRFYLGYVWLGVFKLLTGGGCGIWWIVDIVLIATGSITDARGRPMVKTV